MLLVLICCTICLMEVPLPDGLIQRVKSLQEEREDGELRELEAVAAAEQEQRREREKLKELRQVASTVARLALAKGIETDFTFHKTEVLKRRKFLGNIYGNKPVMLGWKLIGVEHEESRAEHYKGETSQSSPVYVGIVLCDDGKPRSYSTTSKYSGANITGANFSDRLTGEGQWKLGIVLESGLARFVAENNLVLPTQPVQGESTTQ